MPPPGTSTRSRMRRTRERSRPRLGTISASRSSGRGRWAAQRAAVSSSASESSHSTTCAVIASVCGRHCERPAKSERLPAPRTLDERDLRRCPAGRSLRTRAAGPWRTDQPCPRSQCGIEPVSLLQPPAEFGGPAGERLDLRAGVLGQDPDGNAVGMEQFPGALRHGPEPGRQQDRPQVHVAADDLLPDDQAVAGVEPAG